MTHIGLISMSVTMRAKDNLRLALAPFSGNNLMTLTMKLDCMDRVQAFLLYLFIMSFRLRSFLH